MQTLPAVSGRWRSRRDYGRAAVHRGNGTKGTIANPARIESNMIVSTRVGSVLLVGRFDQFRTHLTLIRRVTDSARSAPCSILACQTYWPAKLVLSLLHKVQIASPVGYAKDSLPSALYSRK